MKNFLFRVLIYLYGMEMTQFLSSFGKSALSLVQVNGKTYGKRSHTFYVADEAATFAANRGNILAHITKKTPSYNNIGGNKLPTGQNFLLEGIQIFFDTDNTLDPTTAIWNDTAPASYLNGEIIISVKGTGTVFEAPIADVVNIFASTGNQDNVKNIAPVLLTADTEFEVVLASTGAAFTGLIRVHLIGQLLVNSSMN